MTEMSGYRRVNYYELCRLCTSSEGNKMNIFRDEGRRRQLQSKIHMYLHVQVMEEDSLPKIVCHECVRKLENFSEFRESVVNAEGMLESYFTSMNFNEECLKEGKVYVKSTEKVKAFTPEVPITIQEEDPLKIIEKVPSTPNSQFIASPEPQTSHQQPVLVSNINAANIQIISGQYKQYKCAMQMQSGGGVAAAVVEATAETHYSYQQQTSQQVSSQQQQNQSQNQITEQSPPQPTQINQVQNQIQSQNQISQQVQSFRQISQQSTNQSSQINQHVNQQQSQITQQIQHLQRQRDMQQRHLQQIEKQQHVQASQQQEQQQLQQSQNNNILKSEEATEQTQQVIQKVQSEALKNEVNQAFTTVQASPEVFLSLGFKDSTLSAQVTREDVKDFKEYKSTAEDGRGAMISEFLRLRPVNEASSLITVNPQAIAQSARDVICRDCGKSFASLDMLETHSCSPSLLNEGSDTTSKEDSTHINTNGSAFSCDVCGKPFKRKEHLFQHRKLHSGERPYVCTTCTKAFSRKEHLVRHLVSHTGQKMHECEMCGKSFSRKDNLHKHRKTHGVAGPYICETCGKSFVVKHYYLMHLTTHAGTAIIDNNIDPLPYKCDMCHKAFSVKEYLASHKMRHRSKNTSNSQNSVNGQNSINGQQQEQVQQPSGNEVNVVGNEINSGNTTSANSQMGNGSVPLQSVIERSEQQNGSFGSNQYQGNISQFQ